MHGTCLKKLEDGPRIDSSKESILEYVRQYFTKPTMQKTDNSKPAIKPIDSTTTTNNKPKNPSNVNLKTDPNITRPEKTNTIPVESTITIEPSKPTEEVPYPTVGDPKEQRIIKKPVDSRQKQNNPSRETKCMYCNEEASDNVAYIEGINHKQPLCLSCLKELTNPQGTPNLRDEIHVKCTICGK